MRRHPHTPTLDDLEEGDEYTEAHGEYHRQHSYPLPSASTSTTGSSSGRFKLKSAYSSPSVLPPVMPNNLPSRDYGATSASRGDIYTQFIRRYRQSSLHDDTRGHDHDDAHVHQGIGSLLDGENSDDDDLTMSRNNPRPDLLSSYNNGAAREPADDDERERLEWQTMLASVLDGDVLKSEKTRIAIALEAFSNDRHHSHNKDIWLGLRANLRGVSEKEERKSLEDRRTRYVDTLIHDILEFRVHDTNNLTPPSTSQAIKQVGLILRRLDAIEDLYPSLKALYTDKPLCLQPEFQERRDALLTWINVASDLRHNINSLQKWTGGNIMDSTQLYPLTVPPISSPSPHRPDASSFIERLLKEDSMQRMFEKKSLTTLHSFLMSTRACLVSHAQIFKKLNLPTFRDELIQLISFPSQLVEAILRVRLDYALKVKDPEPLIIDQMIDDFRIAIGLACAIRTEYENHVRPDPAGGWILPQCISAEYDTVILQAVKFLFRLLNWKLKVTAIEEVDVMEFHSALFDEVSLKLTDGSSVVAEELCSLTTKLILRVTNTFEKQVKNPDYRRRRHLSIANRNAVPSIVNGMEPAEKRGFGPVTPSHRVDERAEERALGWYSRSLEEIRLPIRKLMRFTRLLTQRFCNAAEYSLKAVSTDAFINRLVATDHFLVYTQSFEEDGIYAVAHPSLKDRPDTIRQIFRKAFHVDGLFREHATRRTRQSAELEVGDDEDRLYDDEEWNDAAYILLLSPAERFLWNGMVLVLEEPNCSFALREKRVRVVADGPNIRLVKAKQSFLALFELVDGEEPILTDGELDCIEQQQSHLNGVNKELRRIQRSLTRMADVIVESIHHVQRGLRGVSNRQDLLEGWFSFASELGQQAMRYIAPSALIEFNRALTRLAITWVAFICDECDHTDRRTFRWAVNALEFALVRTRRNNILHLPKDQFELLRQKVATCMTLLINHFDILGARSSMEAKQERIRLQELRRHHAHEAFAGDNNDESLSDPPTPDMNKGTFYGPMCSTYEKKTRLEQDSVLRAIDGLTSRRVEIETEQHLIGRVLDTRLPEDRSLVDLVSSGSHISIRWQQGRFIGAGAFGSVYQAINLNTGSLMAVKEIRYQEITGSNLFHQIKEELAVMEMLHHPNVVEFYGIEAHRDKVYIFEEYCQGGSLASLLEMGRIEDEGIIQVYTLQMLEGLIYLHSRGIIHRDVKPDNILLDHMGVIKFVDFGAAKVLAKNQRSIQRSRVAANPGSSANLPPGLAMNNSLTGTPMYMAPEVIRNDKRSRHGAMDIWSLGCVVLECATGRKPWSNLDNEWAIMFHIGVATKHPPLPEPGQLSREGINFIERCLTLDPLLRPTATELVDHVWMLEFRAAMEEYEESETTTLHGSYNPAEKGYENATVALQAAAIQEQEVRELKSETPPLSEPDVTTPGGSSVGTPPE